MSFKNVGRIFLGPFITTIIVLTIIIVSVVFAAISQANGNVQKSTEEHAINDMIDDSDDYAKSILFSYENGMADFDRLLGSEMLTYKIVFLTDSEGNIIAKSQLAKYTVFDDNVFDFCSSGEYDDVDEKSVRTRLADGEVGTYTVKLNRREYFVFRPLGEEGLRLFYMLHQEDVERLYAESEKYLKSVKFLGVAYVSATLALVVLMISYIFSIVKSSDFKLRMSNLNIRNAQEQVRTYSDITKVLSQTYEKIFYVNLANDHYKVFTSSLSDKETPMQYEGEDFWNVICDTILSKTVEEDRARVRSYFDKQTLPELVRKEGTKRIRFKMIIDGVANYYYIKAYPSESDGERCLILGLKNVDAMVVYDMGQIAEKEAALRRVEIYRSALLDNMLAYLELNITEGRIVEGPFISDAESGKQQLVSTSFALPEYIDDLAVIWGEYLYLPGPEMNEYIKKNSSDYLRREFENGNRIVEFNFDAKWNDGSVRGIRQNYYMSKREKDGNIVALCVLYDVTEKNARDREIKNLTEELNKSRVKISTSQMQPHFLYNVLGSIREIILEDPQYASDLICDFTTHLRACIKSMSNDDLIPFSKEIENVKAYVNIEKMRFGDRMETEFDIQYDDFFVVPLSIQPLVENAIRHGLYPKKDGMGKVKVSTMKQNGFIVIVVTDNGVGFDYEKIHQEVREHKRDSTGLLNLTLRLEKVMDAKVYFDSKIGEGTVVTILIPEKKEGAEA